MRNLTLAALMISTLVACGDKDGDDTGHHHHDTGTGDDGGSGGDDGGGTGDDGGGTGDVGGGTGDDGGGTGDDGGGTGDDGGGTGDDGGGGSVGDAANGATIYAATCGGGYCHGPDGAGGGAPSHPEVVPGLSDDELRDIMNNGSGYMGPQGLSAQEVEDVLAYLRATFG